MQYNIDDLDLTFMCYPLPAESCGTHRVYVGSLNETHSDHLDYNGIYTQQSETLQDHAVYKHESHELYMYYMQDVFYGHYWVIGPELGGVQSSTIAVMSPAESPELVHEHWRVNDGSTWRPLGLEFKVQCVDENFMTCSTRRIKLLGLSSLHERFSQYMGLYYIQDGVAVNVRPVYSHEGGQSSLYYTGTVWMVGPEAGGREGSMFVSDAAWRAEYISASWVLFTGQGWVTDDAIRAQCS